ncbi:hypothetical protein CTRI78_v008029 [Colletotrichum trifolii]|uniref:Uncharacterized protein n=1 Tax=Colletotrichum trifolii TaxID=5466 RepID=A0A4V3HV17_COLTR|nr:hypothetical protein CTRI78_v008029 [Colletotrichum trifolii]
MVCGPAVTPEYQASFENFVKITCLNEPQAAVWTGTTCNFPSGYTLSTTRAFHPILASNRGSDNVTTRCHWASA